MKSFLRPVEPRLSALLPDSLAQAVASLGDGRVPRRLLLFVVFLLFLLLSGPRRPIFATGPDLHLHLQRRPSPAASAHSWERRRARLTHTATRARRQKVKGQRRRTGALGWISGSECNPGFCSRNMPSFPPFISLSVFACLFLPQAAFSNFSPLSLHLLSLIIPRRPREDFISAHEALILKRCAFRIPADLTLIPQGYTYTEQEQDRHS